MQVREASAGVRIKVYMWMHVRTQTYPGFSATLRRMTLGVTVPW